MSARSSQTGTSWHVHSLTSGLATSQAVSPIYPCQPVHGTDQTPVRKTNPCDLPGAPVLTCTVHHSTSGPPAGHVADCSSLKIQDLNQMNSLYKVHRNSLPSNVCCHVIAVMSCKSPLHVCRGFGARDPCGFWGKVRLGTYCYSVYHQYDSTVAVNQHRRRSVSVAETAEGGSEFQYRYTVHTDALLTD